MKLLRLLLCTAVVAFGVTACATKKPHDSSCCAGKTMKGACCAK